MIEAEWWEYDIDRRTGRRGRRRRRLHHRKRGRRARLVADRAARRHDAAPRSIRKLAAQKLPWKRVTIIPTDDRLVPMDSELSNVRAIAQAFLPAGARVVPIATDDRRLPAGRQFGRRAAAGPAVAARPRLARHGRGRAHRVDLRRARPAGCARCAQGPPRGRRDARSAARRCAGAAGDPDPRRDPVGADAPDHHHRRREARSCSSRRSTTGTARKLPIGRVLAEAEQPIDIHWAP